jgi:hypothetical protein
MFRLFLGHYQASYKRNNLSSWIVLIWIRILQSVIVIIIIIIIANTPFGEYKLIIYAKSY